MTIDSLIVPQGDAARVSAHAGRSVGSVRQFVPEDLQGVVELYHRVYGAVSVGFAAYLEKILLHNPWASQDYPSFVYEENKHIAGFLGVIPRRMILHNRSVRVAISNHFMVSPATRSTLAAVQLMKRFFAGPQDLSLAEGNASSRKLWEALGGMTSLLYSVHWTRPLRPARYFASRLQGQSASRMFVPGSRLICKLLDHLAAGFVAANPFRFAPQSAEEELSLDALLDFLSSLPSVDYTLRPSYDRHSLNWLLEILESKNLHGRLRKTLVRKPSGEAAGWYIYYVNPGGISEVLQIGANSDSVKLVTQHMAYCAWKHGAFALTGRIDPRFMDELSEQNFLFHRGNRPWMLIHSKDPGILASFHRGRAFVTRMEGEWWVGSRRQEISSAGTP